MLARWAPPKVERVLPRETLLIAMGAGVRYVAMSPNIRSVILRAFAYGFGGIVALALLPLIARDLVKGGPLFFGIMLGAFGAGAVVGAFLSARLRRMLSTESLVRATFGANALAAGPHQHQHDDVVDLAGAGGGRRLLGDDALDLQRDGAALRRALGCGPGAGDLPDGSFSAGWPEAAGSGARPCCIMGRGRRCCSRPFACWPAPRWASATGCRLWRRSISIR